MAVVTLKYPLDAASGKIEALTVRRADAGALRLLDRVGALSLMQKLAEDQAAAEAAALAAGKDPEQVETPLPNGLIDKIVPFLARLCRVDEATIEALDAEDFMSLMGTIDEVMPADPLAGRAGKARPTTSTAS